MKNQKNLFFMIMLSLTMLFMVGVLTNANASNNSMNGIGTTGGFGDMPLAVTENLFLTITVNDLTQNSEYIITGTTGSGISNITFDTSSRSTQSFTRQISSPAGGVVTLSLYGYNITSGANQGSALATKIITVTPASTYNVNILTDYLGLFVAGGIIVGIVVMFRKKVL